jgi:hypothetical protein
LNVKMSNYILEQQKSEVIVSMCQKCSERVEK